MVDWFVKIFFFFFLALIAGNLLFIDFVWVKSNKPVAEKEVKQEISQVSNSVSCQDSCVKLIKDEVKKAVAELPAPTVAIEPDTKTPTPEPTINLSAPKVSFMTLASSGSTNSTSWADIDGTDFYFDLVDYPTARTVSWEVSLQSYLSLDPAYIRLYDITNKRGIDGSELSTRSSTYSFLRSGALTIWRGNNLYRIQVKGSNGNVVNFVSPRLKIIIQ